MENLYEKFLSKENFYLAYTRLKTMKNCEYKNFYRDDFKAFENFFDTNIEVLIKEIENQTYEPSACYRFYVPKKKDLARPFSLLLFKDLIVYQALANVIGDVVYNVLFLNFDKYTFGNQIIRTDDENKIFAYNKWIQQWKKFRHKIKEEYESGFNVISNYDIASFYDTIDHTVLIQILDDKYRIDKKILDILHKCLEKWVVVSNNNFNYTKKSGIPQGPISSHLFAEIYLNEIDETIIKKRGNKVKYLRYADDIIIMSKSELECQKTIVYLDLLCKDYSLIPQTEKINKLVFTDKKSFHEYVDNGGLNFSEISGEYKRIKKLSDKKHKKLKSEFIDCFNDESKNYMNKTIIRFALFKLNKDDDIKNTIISNIDNLQGFFNEIVYYFNRFYPNDTDVKNCILTQLKKDNILYQYNKSIIFSDFSNLEYDEDFLLENIPDEDKFWLVKYRIIQWLLRIDETNIVDFIKNTENNYFIEKEIIKCKLKRYKDVSEKRLLAKSYFTDSREMLSLIALSDGNWFNFREKDIQNIPSQANNYVKNIFELPLTDFFQNTMLEIFNVTVSAKWLAAIKINAERERGLNDNLMIYKNNKEENPIDALMALDGFNNLIYDVWENCETSNGDYGSKINKLHEIDMKVEVAFDKIHKCRSSQTYAHPKDQENRIVKKRIDKKGLNDLIIECKLDEVYKTISDYYEDK